MGLHIDSLYCLADDISKNFRMGFYVGGLRRVTEEISPSLMFRMGFYIETLCYLAGGIYKNLLSRMGSYVESPRHLAGGISQNFRRGFFIESLHHLTEKLSQNFRMGFYMNLPILLALGIFCAQFLNIQYRRWKHRRESRLRGCKPANTLSQNKWYLGLDVVQNMISSYESGSRNVELSLRHRKYGPTFRTTPFGTARIFTIDPENLKAVFGGKPGDWGVEPVRYEAFRPFVAGGVLVTDGERWKNSREISQAIIDRIYRHYSYDLTTFDHNIQSLLERIPTDGSTVDLQPLLYQYTMDSSTENIFGKRIGALRPGPEGDYGRDFLESFIYCLKMAGQRDEVPQWTYFVLDRKFRKSCRTLKSYADKNIHYALGRCIDKEYRTSSASQWARSATDLVEARDQIMNVIAASFDTIAILLTNTFFHLARNPDCYAKLREEVMSFEGQPDIGSIKSLQYLHFVLNESLRLNGPASFNSRVALRDMTIPRGGGPDGSYPIFVPKGDLVIVSAFALQRQAEVYGAEPDQYRPERWENLKPKHWDFIPFSAGPRVCPGQKFALMHGAYLLFSLVKRFRTVENRDPEWEFVEEYRIATGSKNGARIALRS